jgi:hypothetical protein
MIRHHIRIARTLAVMVAFTMIAQIAGAQSMKCEMRSTHMNQDRGAIVHHDHSDDSGSPASSRGDSHSSGAMSCSQVMICANAAVVSARESRAFQLGDGTLQISFDRHALQARTVRPEPPPPRI